MGERRGAGQERDRDRCGGDDRLRRDQRALPQHSELARQLSVLAERVGKASEPGDRGGRGREEDQRAGEADEHLQRVADPVGTSARISAATPTSGARSQLLPSSVPWRAGNADRATTAIAT